MITDIPVPLEPLKLTCRTTLPIFGGCLQCARARVVVSRQSKDAAFACKQYVTVAPPPHISENDYETTSLKGICICINGTSESNSDSELIGGQPAKLPHSKLESCPDDWCSRDSDDVAYHFRCYSHTKFFQAGQAEVYQRSYSICWWSVRSNV